MRVSDDGSKRPLVRWQYGGLRDPRAIVDRLSRPDIDESVVLAVTTGGALNGGGYLVGLDFDVHKNGLDAFARLQLPTSPTSATPRGGRHVLMSTPEPLTSFERGDGVEIKGVGALLTMPPGRGAQWLVDGDRTLLDPFSVPIAPMPAELVEVEQAGVLPNLNLRMCVRLEELCSG